MYMYIFLIYIYTCTKIYIYYIYIIHASFFVDTAVSADFFFHPGKLTKGEGDAHRCPSCQSGDH